MRWCGNAILESILEVDVRQFSETGGIVAIPIDGQGAHGHQLVNEFARILHKPKVPARIRRKGHQAGKRHSHCKWRPRIGMKVLIANVDILDSELQVGDDLCGQFCSEVGILLLACWIVPSIRIQPSLLKFLQLLLLVTLQLLFLIDGIVLKEEEKEKRDEEKKARKMLWGRLGTSTAIFGTASA